ncbi:Type I secretion protein [Pseudomonas sp. IT-347P]|uniref:calcium-binding protein n=1 Tax=Pseudomonas sp. IT-347P TaxID=3026458 RepID=UPI0039DF3C9D
MAILIQEASIQTDSVVITDIGFHANERNESTLDFKSDANSQTSTTSKSKTAQLRVADDVFGPMKIGSVSITRVSLDALGATIGGQPLNGKNTFFRIPKRSFINSLQFSPVNIEAQMKSSTGPDAYLLPTLLFEIASQRPLTYPRMLREDIDPAIDPDGHHRKLAKLLDTAHKLDLTHIQVPKHTPKWAARAKTYLALGSSVGVQSFGIFMGLRGLVSAIKLNDRTETAINSVGLLSEGASIAADITITKIGTQMIKAGQAGFRDFAKTRFALRLSRSGGLIGGAFTLPFDIYMAVRAFNAAENKTGKAAMDHFVEAGLSITSAAMTVILGAAAMAGFSFAGPVGLAAGLMMAVGSQIYGAVRLVDDIDDYIDLTDNERWRTGWFTFCFMSPDDSVQDRYTLAKAKIEHAKQLKATARRLLDGELKDTTEAIVNGAWDVELKPTQVWTRDWWTKQDGWETVKVPVIKDGDDTIDAREGVTAKTPGAELGAAAEHKGVLWFIGDGQDSIQGVEKKPNTFYYGSGAKDLTGGEKDDHFVFNAAGKRLKPDAELHGDSILRGGAGNDTLSLGGFNSVHSNGRAGYSVHLPAGTLATIIPAPSNPGHQNRTSHSRLESIENVDTLDSGVSIVSGTDQRNIIKARGEDTIFAGAGNDQIHLLHKGVKAHGGAGADEYVVAHKEGDMCIYEDGEQESLIVLDWNMDLIKRWSIKGDTLLVTSGFKFLDRTKNEVFIHGVYKKTDNQWRLKNNKLIFITKDGFHLSPELPETAEEDTSVDIEVVITKLGQAERPVILYSPDCSISHQRDVSFYIPKMQQHFNFYSTDRKHGLTKLYLDYSSTELTKAEAHFFARLRDNEKPELAAGCDLTYHFGEHSLTLKLFSYAFGGEDAMNMIKILRTMAVRPRSRYLLIFNDGVAFDAELTDETDAAPDNADYKKFSFTTWTTSMTLPMKPRSGRYAYELPANQAYELSARYACAKLTSYPGQTAMEHLLGQGSTYLIHLAAATILKIETPGALATATVRLPFASTWELDATALGDIEIKLENNRLQLGTCTIHLPIYDSDDLIDQVRVISASGLVHTVDLSFDRVYVEGLDARFFTPPDAASPLPKELSSVADKELKVRNIAPADGSSGTVAYSLSKHCWLFDSVVIEHAALKIINRCSHQLPDIFLPMPPITVPAA